MPPEVGEPEFAESPEEVTVTQIFLRASVDSQDLESKVEQIGKQARVVAEKS